MYKLLDVTISFSIWANLASMCDAKSIEVSTEEGLYEGRGKGLLFVMGSLLIVSILKVLLIQPLHVGGAVWTVQVDVRQRGPAAVWDPATAFLQENSLQFRDR